jgi:hypothetical protein
MLSPWASVLCILEYTPTVRAACECISTDGGQIQGLWLGRYCHSRISSDYKTTYDDIDYLGAQRVCRVHSLRMISTCLLSLFSLPKTTTEATMQQSEVTSPNGAPSGKDRGERWRKYFMCFEIRHRQTQTGLPMRRNQATSKERSKPGLWNRESRTPFRQPG